MAQSGQGFLETLTNQYDSIHSEIENLKGMNAEKDQEIEDLREELQDYSRLKLLLEDIDSFQFNIKLTDPSLIEAARLICFNLYPSLTRDYIDWKENGGKRPKDPVRQLFIDIIKYVVLEKKDWLRSEFRNYGVSYRNDTTGVDE